MDQELKAALQGMAERLGAELRADIQASAAQLREDAVNRESRLRADIQASAARLREDAAERESRVREETVERESRLREELLGHNRHLGVLVEALRGDIQVVAEGVLHLDRKFDRLTVAEDQTRGRVDGLELRVLALEQAERERRRQG